MNALDYLLRSTLYLLLFAGCYQLLLRRTTYFGLNRAYLLLTLLASLLLPFASLPDSANDTLPTGVITLPSFTVGRQPQPMANDWSVPTVLWIIYALGALTMLCRLAWRLGAIYQLIQQGSAERRVGYVLVRLTHNRVASFSFGRYLVLNRTDAQIGPDALIHHEEAHIRQRHTFDVIGLEMMQVLLWFNLTLWYYKRAVQEVHEFLADKAAAAQLSTGYAHQLVAYVLDAPVAALTTPFLSFSTLKQRVIMLHKPASSRRALLGYALVLPLAATLLMCTQAEQDKPTTQAEATANASARKPVKVDGEVYMVVEHQPEFPGGMEQLGNYMTTHLKYPAAAEKANVEGRVFVSFIVTKTGEITDVRVLKDVGFGTGEEAVRVVSEMPRWTPAKQDGHVVNVRYNLPINFALDSAEEPTSYLKDVKTVMVNGNEVSKAELQKIPTDMIIRVEVDKDHSTIAITTK